MTEPTPPTAAERATAAGVDDANRFALHPRTAECIHETAKLLGVDTSTVANGAGQFYAFIADLVAKGWTLAGIDPDEVTHPIEWSGFDSITTKPEGTTDPT